MNNLTIRTFTDIAEKYQCMVLGGRIGPLGLFIVSFNAYIICIFRETQEGRLYVELVIQMESLDIFKTLIQQQDETTELIEG